MATTRSVHRRTQTPLRSVWASGCLTGAANRRGLVFTALLLVAVAEGSTGAMEELRHLTEEAFNVKPLPDKRLSE